MTTSNPEQKEGTEFKDRFNGRCRRGWRIPVFILAIILVKGAVTLVLWNWLVPELFHGPVLTYFQAVGLLLLAKLFFGFGFRPGFGHGRFGPGWQRWEGLSPEEREKMRAEIRSRCH